MVEVEVSSPDLNGKASSPHHRITMAPSEGEVAMGKRKDQCISEPEGSGKKKKSKPQRQHQMHWKRMGPEEKLTLPLLYM
ncbi:hypothetical protein KY289_016221 [Solanum tuberosum]|nr:hypothetical protein KY289_016221 [Solanum tuberosum]